tara:strand:- start:4888 stop:5076 length:189 start_codon:yes stop_codon:yes gene_type:complete
MIEIFLWVGLIFYLIVVFMIIHDAAKDNNMPDPVAFFAMVCSFFWPIMFVIAILLKLENKKG